MELIYKLTPNDAINMTVAVHLADIYKNAFWEYSNLQHKLQKFDKTFN